MVEYDVSNDKHAAERMVRRFGRVATPAIVIGKRVFWGFAENRSDIAELLGIDEPRAPAHAGAEPEGTAHGGVSDGADQA
ncbi:MAG: hypothetical protein KKA32_12930 [Actinobacteria bacterium]|nr:hypothetical protein [Actinomycetota bacterium]